MVDILSPLTVDGKVRSKDVSTLDSTDSDDTLTPKGYVDSVSESKLDRAGGLLTGPLTVEGGANINTSGHIEGTMLRTTADTHLAMAPPKYAVLDSSGWVYHRTLDETKSDLGITSKQDKLEAGMNITIDGNTISAKGATYEVATETSDGLMSSGDKSQLIALDSAISTHVNSTSNPHNVTKSQIGLGDVDNTSDLYKPISIAVQEALNLKADKSEISRIYRPCGSVATINDLPSDAQIGDVYDVAETGMNYAWVEIGGVAKWDSLGMLSDKIDMTNYYTKGQVDEALAGKAGTSVATQSANGLMSTDDKKKLDGIDTGAQKNTITGVKGSSESTYRTGNVSISPANIGLGNVNNTSDADKPISTATQSALSGKQATITGAATTITDNNLTANRVLISNNSGKVTVSEVTSAELGYLDGVTSNVQTQLDGKSADGHTHDDRYYTESEVDSLLSNKAGVSVATTSANGLMSSSDKTKLNGIESGANKTIVDNALSDTSTNPVQNKVVTSALKGKQATLSAGTNISIVDNVISAVDTKYGVVTQSADGLMSSADKKKLDGIATGANKTTVDSALSSTSTNPVQNKVVYAELDKKLAADGTAVKSTADANGNNIVDTYETKANAITGLSASGRTITYTKGDGSTGTITTQDNNTDTKVTQTNSTGTGAYPILLKNGTGTGTITNTVIFDDGVTIQPSTGTLTATKFKGPLEGNVTGNCSGSSGSCTGNSATATKAEQLTTARTIAISGGATGTATSFNGTANITIPVTALDVSKANAGTLAVARGGTGATNLANVTVGKATALNVSSTSAIAITAGVQFISTTILSQTGNWFIETHVSGTNIFQRATSMADPSNVCVRTSSNSGSSWNDWVFSYAVWK